MADSTDRREVPFDLRIPDEIYDRLFEKFGVSKEEEEDEPCD